jgi:RNA polymerase sigma factor (sigma-70 family)
VAGPGFDLPAALRYIGPERAAAVETREFDYDVLVRPMEGRMMRSIWRIVRQREAAEDALQDALTVIWKKRNAVALHPKPEALILRIAVSAAYDAVRKSRRRLRHEIPGLSDERADGAAPPVSQRAEDRDLRAAILEAIGHLPRRQATAVLLRVVEEQSYEDIARVMGCSESTVRVNVMRGRERLASRLARELPGVAGRLEWTGKEAAS